MLYCLKIFILLTLSDMSDISFSRENNLCNIGRVHCKLHFCESGHAGIVV